MDSLKDIKVSCYAGYKGEQTPRSFHLWDREISVVEVLDQWVGPDHRYFKVRGDDDAEYILRHDERLSQWDLSVYSKGHKLPSLGEKPKRV